LFNFLGKQWHFQSESVCNDDGAQLDGGVDVAPDWDEAAQLTPDFEVDQRISW
jgi:hypothetical protein